MTLQIINNKDFSILNNKVNNSKEMLKNTNLNILPEPLTMFKLALPFLKSVIEHNQKT